MEQWHDTESALAKLYRYAEGRAIEATDWYLQDKRGKRICPRGLRLLAILLVNAGGLQPLLDAAAPRAPSTPSRSRTGWPCCGPSPTTWPPCSSRRRPSGCSSSRATCCASS